MPNLIVIHQTARAYVQRYVETKLAYRVPASESLEVIESDTVQFSIGSITRQRKVAGTPTSAGRLSVPRLTFRTSSKVKRSKVNQADLGGCSSHPLQGAGHIVAATCHTTCWKESQKLDDIAGSRVVTHSLGLLTKAFYSYVYLSVNSEFWASWKTGSQQCCENCT